MIAIYLILTLAVKQCPSNGWSPNWLQVTPSVNTQVNTLSVGTINACQCTAENKASFTTIRAAAETALENGARVWKIGVLPSGIVELKREAKTTFSVSESPVNGIIDLSQSMPEVK